MDALNAIGVGTGISRAAALRSSDVEARKAPEDKHRDETFSGVVDPVSLSREARIRQDVVRSTGDESSGGPRGEDEAASAAERERVRELLLQDMKERSASAGEGVDRSIRSLPSFEYDIGPYGRAYAVGEGAQIERPEPPASPSSSAGDSKPAEETTEPLPPGWGAPVVAEATTSDPEAADEEKAALEDGSNTQVPHEPVDGDPSSKAPPATLGDAWANAAQAAAPGIDHHAERSARAYALAQTLTRAPGGFESTSVDAFV